MKTLDQSNSNSNRAKFYRLYFDIRNSMKRLRTALHYPSNLAGPSEKQYSEETRRLPISVNRVVAGHLLAAEVIEAHRDDDSRQGNLIANMTSRVPTRVANSSPG